MIIEPQIIFVDESGNLALPNDDSLSYYTINAIYFNKNDLGYYKNKAQDIVKKYTGNGELKSKNIGNNFKRRESILKDISSVKFPFYCLVIDKSRIFKDSGLRFKTSSYKYLHRMFYERIKRTFYNIDLISDPYGTSEFMKSFVNYIKSQGNLFENIIFKPSQEEPLLQISDVIAGSIRRVYMGQDPINSLEILGYPSLAIEEWPPNVRKFSEYIPDEENEFNILIREIALRRARDFIEKNIDTDDLDLRTQAEVVRFLLIKFYEDPTQYVYRNEIENYLKSISIECNYRTILSKLRDNNVIICSSEKGVKIPFDSNDISQWIHRANSQIVPYLKRISKVQMDLLIASHSKYNIVNKEEYPELSKLLNEIKGV